ncbi:MAG: ComEA family DNA-binding protein [Planctomycetota bacterium]|jgi:competence ComEA-like helix-hairpin-helix protein
MTPTERDRRRRAGRYLGLLLALPVLVHGMRGWGRALTDGPARERPAPLQVDLARDPPARLVFLPGIGAHRAEAIVRDRRENGPLRALEEIVRIPGIGEVTLRRLYETRWIRAVVHPAEAAAEGSGR